MAKSAVTIYSSFLKEISNGLTDQDVADMKLLLRYPAATKIATGTQLLAEMERQDDLDEDNLETLKDVLGQQNLKRLVKIVEKFEKASSTTSQGHVGDQLTKSWPSSAFEEKKEQQPKDRLSQSATSAGFQDQLHNPLQYQQVLQQSFQGVAPSASYHGNLPQEYQQQPQLTPGLAYQQSPQSQHQQSSPYPGNVPTTMGYYTPNQPQFPVQQQQQQQPQQQQQMMWNQQQHCQTPSSQFAPMNPPQAWYPVPPFPPGSHTGSQAGIEPHSIQRVKSVPSSTSSPGGLGHAKVVASKSSPSQFGGAPKELSHVSEEEEAGLKHAPSNARTTKEMNIPAENIDAVAKPTGEKTINGNIVMGTSSMAGESSPGGLASQVFNGNTTSMNGRGQGTVPFQAARVRANSEEKNNESMGEGVHPMSQQMTETETDLLLLSGFSGKKLYDCRKVDFITDGTYQVRIPQGVHYFTSEGAFVIVPFNSSYTIDLKNNGHRRCSALVENNGKWAGDWTIDSMGSIVLERPATYGKKFHFVEASRAPVGSGVRVDDPNNGVICVTFTPEKDETLNDLSRGIGHLGISSNGDYFETDTMNDVQRSIAPQPNYDRLQGGCTIFQGDSHQQFTISEDFQLDNARKSTIQLKLVGKAS